MCLELLTVSTTRAVNVFPRHTLAIASACALLLTTAWRLLVV